MEKTILTVEGMSCAHCVKAVSDAVGALAGVKNVAVDLATKTVAVTHDIAESPVAQIKLAIEDQGYDVV